MFQLLIYPRILKRVGARKSQRWACCVAIPTLLAYPFLRRLHDSEAALLAASLVLLFLINMASNAVGATLASVQSISRACSNCLAMLVYDVRRSSVTGRAEHFDTPV